MACILATDDRPINRQFLATLLAYGGHKMLEASDGEEALSIVRRWHPDLVITDIRMPKMDGYEFLDRLRREPNDAATPVIFYTALYHEREARIVADFHGVADIITKPSEPEEILKKVNAALGLRRTSAQNRATTIEAEERYALEALQATGLKLAALVELGMELGSERDAERLLRRFCSTARHIIGARKSMLGILSENGDELKHFIINGDLDAQPLVHDRPPVHQPVLASIINDRKAVRINQADPTLRLEQLSPDNSSIQSFLGAPIMSATDVYGWLVLLEKQNGAGFSKEDERMAITLAAQAAIAYENAVLSERLRRKAEALDRTRLEQLEVKDQFISHVSHELRSPLSALHQFTTILLDGLAGEISGVQREYLEIVLKNSLQLRDMIDDLLEVSRAQAGQLTINPQLISLGELFRPISQTYEQRAAAKQIAFRTSCPPDLPLVQADPNRLGQVLTNLLDNALKFSTQGAISISAYTDEDHEFVRVGVADTGCGISADSLPRIFDRLYQSPNSVELSRKGLGLGLHICKHLVELHGGRIWAESKEGEGTTVFFTVPVNATHERKNNLERK